MRANAGPWVARTSFQLGFTGAIVQPTVETFPGPFDKYSADAVLLTQRTGPRKPFVDGQPHGQPPIPRRASPRTAACATGRARSMTPSFGRAPITRTSPPCDQFQVHTAGLDRRPRRRRGRPPISTSSPSCSKYPRSRASVARETGGGGLHRLPPQSEPRRLPTDAQAGISPSISKGAPSRRLPGHEPIPCSSTHSPTGTPGFGFGRCK